MAISCAKFLMSSVRVRHKQKFSFHWKLSKTNFNFSALQIYGFLHLLHSPLAISRVLGMALSCSWPVSILLTFKYQFANKLYWSLLRMVFVGIDWTLGSAVIYRAFNVLWHNGFLRLAKRADEEVYVWATKEKGIGIGQEQKQMQFPISKAGALKHTFAFSRSLLNCIILPRGCFPFFLPFLLFAGCSPPV